ncbi:MAG: hypothetical protein ACK6DF_10430 [Betaproteobacteria bacterium]
MQARSAQAPVARDAFTQAMSRAVTGVSVVCAEGPLGPVALTVSAVAPRSPPASSVCTSMRW